MNLWQIWGITLVVAAVYLAVCSELDLEAAKMQRCSHTHCA